MECIKSSFDNPVAYKTMRKIPQREALERNILATRMAVVQFWCLGLVLYVLYVVQSGEAVSLSEANRRIRQCCQANDIEDCGMICKYDLTEAEIRENGPSCLDKIKVLLYCASEGRDHTAACQSAGLSRKCQTFCNGQGPALCFDDESINHYRECAAEDKLRTILNTHKEQLGSSSRWESNHKFPADKCADKK